MKTTGAWPRSLAVVVTVFMSASLWNAYADEKEAPEKWLEAQAIKDLEARLGQQAKGVQLAEGVNLRDAMAAIEKSTGGFGYKIDPDPKENLGERQLPEFDFKGKYALCVLLKALLRPNDLDFTISHGSIYISTPEGCVREAGAALKKELDDMEARAAAPAVKDLEAWLSQETKGLNLPEGSTVSDWTKAINDKFPIVNFTIGRDTEMVPYIAIEDVQLPEFNFQGKYSLCVLLKVLLHSVNLDFTLSHGAIYISTPGGCVREAGAALKKELDDMEARALAPAVKDLKALLGRETKPLNVPEGTTVWDIMHLLHRDIPGFNYQMDRDPERHVADIQFPDCNITGKYPLCVCLKFLLRTVNLDFTISHGAIYVSTKGCIRHEGAAAKKELDDMVAAATAPVVKDLEARLDQETKGWKPPQQATTLGDAMFFFQDNFRGVDYMIDPDLEKDFAQLQLPALDLPEKTTVRGLLQAVLRPLKLDFTTADGYVYIFGAAGFREQAGIPAGTAEAKPQISPDWAELVKGNNRFALELYSKLSAGKKGNIFFSPFSTSSALAMTYAGARGNTAAEIANVLHFTLGQDKLHPAMRGMVDDILAPGKEKKPPYEISVANALWGQKGAPFLGTFLDLTQMYYKAGFRTVDFDAEPQKACDAINAWVEEQTRGKIRQAVQPADITALTRLLLTNAIYFHGNWDCPFDKNATLDAPFTLADNTHVKAPMMEQRGEFSYARLDHGDLLALEMPYVSKRLSMVIFLPAAPDGLPELEESLTEDSLVRRFAVMESTRVDVLLPRFKTRDRFDLGDTLQAMGMKDAFEPTKGNFAGIIERNSLFISKVIHEAFIDVNEEGTEAAAATTIVGGISGVGSPPPPEYVLFRADHPFLFLIRDNRTGSILFIGRIMDPRD